ncbi:hypothetical protein D1007_18474 [Hordeum vulgare]|nr:hypothetical protein D1007_18474 [Hordeum vulgare]
MASAGSSTTLLLKATFIAAMLAVLVLPSMGRCPSLEPQAAPTPAPAPSLGPQAAPTPAPAPAIRCSDCDKRCFDSCYAKTKVTCNYACNIAFYGCSGCWNQDMPKCVKPCESDCRAAACVSD